MYNNIHKKIYHYKFYIYTTIIIEGNVISFFNNFNYMNIISKNDKFISSGRSIIISYQKITNLYHPVDQFFSEESFV